MDFTPAARHIFGRLIRQSDQYAEHASELQGDVLRRLISTATRTDIGMRHNFAEMGRLTDYRMYAKFAQRVPLVEYEEIRPLIMRIATGEADVLWPGRCYNFAQSSGTSGGRSKYIPITRSALRNIHYRGSAMAVASYLRLNPKSRMFSGKGLILGGSFVKRPKGFDPSTHVGDLSATMIRHTPFPASLFRIPGMDVALISDWEKKLPAIAEAAIGQNITNISGVPSWFLVVIRKVMELTGAKSLLDVWPNLEVFIHGGISFDPYRAQYKELTTPDRPMSAKWPGMHFLETYNASEGFFAVQTDFDDTSLLLLLDSDVFYEFIPVAFDGSEQEPVTISYVEPGKTYELVITASNGLWRYRLGDTVTVVQTNPVKIKLAGRTKTFINAFGEELMENNAEAAIAKVCSQTGSSISNYTAAPVYTEEGKRGRHEWLIEWSKKPESVEKFAALLDEELQRLNSDYAAKRAHTIFLDPLSIVSLPRGTFDRWLSSVGSKRLGGQRKVPRLSNDRTIADPLLSLLK